MRAAPAAHEAPPTPSVQAMTLISFLSMMFITRLIKGHPLGVALIIYIINLNPRARARRHDFGVWKKFQEILRRGVTNALLLP